MWDTKKTAKNHSGPNRRGNVYSTQVHYTHFCLLSDLLLAILNGPQHHLVTFGVVGRIVSKIGNTRDHGTQTTQSGGQEQTMNWSTIAFQKTHATHAPRKQPTPHQTTGKPHQTTLLNTSSLNFFSNIGLMESRRAERAKESQLPVTVLNARISELKFK